MISMQKKMLQVLTDPEGIKFLKEFIPKDEIDFISDKFGISGVANLIAAIKIAKYYNFNNNDNIFIVATDSIDRYRSVMKDLTKKYGVLDRTEAKSRTERILLYQEPSWIFEGDEFSRQRWHNLKYYTWVEQQGKSVDELNVQKSKDYWLNQQKIVEEMDEKILDYRKKHEDELRNIFFSD